MSSSYYDVVVVGADLAPLSCGALLAKRGFRVLVVPHDAARGRYRVGPYRLPHRPFSFRAHGSPIAHRVLTELGLAQIVRQLGRPLDPAFQLAMPGHRVDVRRDAAAMDAELEREFPTTKRPILDFHEHALDLARRSDPMFDGDALWPPEGLWRRRSRRTAGLPVERDGAGPDLLAELPDDHPLRAALVAAATFGSDSDETRPSTLALARLYASACRDPRGFEAGEDALAERLIERIHSHSGAVRTDERIETIVPRRSGPFRVTLGASGHEIAAGFVIAGIDVAALIRLLPNRGPFEELFDRQGEPQVRGHRYTLNVVLRRGALPDALAHDLYRVGEVSASTWADGSCHLQRSSLDDGHELVCMEALLPNRRVETERGYLEGVRERLLAALEDVAPFFREHLVCVDSPHDGRPPDGFADDIPLDLDAADRRGAATMTVTHGYPVTSYFGLCAMPVRTPIRHLLLCNRQVLPPLGLEGQLLAAASAARVVSRADRRREWMRQGLWNRVRI